MTTKKQAAKKKPAKRAGGKAGGKTGGKVSDIAASPVRTDAEVDEIVDRGSERAEKWAEAWRMKAMGVPYRVIAQRMGLPDHKTAIRHVRSHERLVDGDPDRVSDRAEVVAYYDLAIEKMMAELTVLEATEQRKPKDERAPVWLSHSKPLLDALGAKWRVVAPHSPQKQVTVELGAAASSGAGVPGPLAGVLARVTITDNEDAA